MRSEFALEDRDTNPGSGSCVRAPESELPAEEREHVGLLGGPLAHRFADPVAGAALLMQ